MRAEMASSRTYEVDTAINSFLHLDQADQVSLLEVIDDYFTIPSSSFTVDSDSDSDELDQDETGNVNDEIDVRN